MSSQKDVEHVKIYAGQVLKFTADIQRALTELIKHLDRLPAIAAEAHKADELERREQAVAARERELRERMRRVDELMGEGE